MTSRVNKELALLCHPYLFALKEGDVSKNPFDYSLLLMQRNCTEVIKSPTAETPVRLMSQMFMPPPF